MKNHHVYLFALNVTVVVLNAINMCINLFAGKYTLALMYLFITVTFAISGHSYRQKYFEKRKEIKDIKAEIFEKQLKAQKKKELHEKFTNF